MLSTRTQGRPESLDDRETVFDKQIVDGHGVLVLGAGNLLA